MELELVPEQGRAVALFEGSPKEVIARATEMADELKKVIDDQKLYTNIQGKKHVHVEGWTTLGAMLGVFPIIEWCRPTMDANGDQGWEAKCAVKRATDGAIIGAAEAQCTRSEKTWATRDDYALRSMAQTRATSKAMRLPLAWVMTLAGYEATPFEEMPTTQEPDAPVARRSPPTPPESGAVVDEPVRQADDSVGKLRGDLRKALDAKFRGDGQAIFSFVEIEYREAIEGTRVLYQKIPAEECDRMIALLIKAP